MAKSKIIVIGGGFGGVKCAKTLRRSLSSQEHGIVLFNPENHMVFHPLLAEVAGASLHPTSLAAPLRRILPAVECRTEEVLNIDLERSQIEYKGHDGMARRMDYDHVVIACGAAVNMAAVPGMADDAFSLRTVGDALAVRAHVSQQLERAEVCEDTQRRRWYLSFIIVGGGFSGAEVAGEINDLVRGSRRFFRNIAEEDIGVTLIHSRSQLLPEVSPRLRDIARARMEEAGIRMILNSRVELVTPEGVRLQSGTMIRGATVVSTVGNAPSPVVERLEATKERGRLLCEPEMRLRGFSNAWAVGDCARIVNTYDGSISPATGQFAERQGKQVARNIVRVLQGRNTRAFSYKPIGQLCSIGGKKAVGEILGVSLSGFLAWFIWRGVYLFKMPSWSRRLKVGFDWAWELFFSRDLAHLKADPTDRVGRACYHPGDYIFRREEPAANFYVIQKGEVEVLRARDGVEDAETVAVLGCGDFFGEMALLDDRPRRHSVRARTSVEVLVMGRKLFSRISQSLAPLRENLAAAVRRRTSIWQNLPQVRSILEQEPLASFVEPLPTEPLKGNVTLEQVITLLNRKGLDFYYVVDEADRLTGVLTRTDLLRAMEAMASTPVAARPHIKVEDIMVANPITASLEDSSVVMMATMREHGLKKLPIVESRDARSLKGYVRVERIMDLVLQKLHGFRKPGVLRESPSQTVLPKEFQT